MSAEVFIHFHPERHNEIQYHWRSQRETGGINKIKPDAAGRNIHHLAQACADTKCLAFDKIPEFVHTSNNADNQYVTKKVSIPCKSVLRGRGISYQIYIEHTRTTISETKSFG